MPEKKVVIIGYGTGGMTAAAYVKNYCRECKVIVFEKRAYPIYHPCSLPDVISGYLKPEDIVEKEPMTPGLEFYTSTIVTKIDRKNKKVHYKGPSGEGEVEYDNLVLAMGSIPWAPGPLRKALELNNVYTLKTPEDAVAIRTKALNSKKAVVVGAGAIGIETALALHELGLEVYLIEALKEILPGALDPDMGKIVHKYIEEQGVKVFVESPVSSITESNGKLVVEVKDEKIEADFVVMATGMKPNTQLAAEAGIELNERGFIKVDDYLRTSDPDIYAVGDLIVTKDYITGQPTVSMLATPAFHQGRIAGLNIAGFERKYPGTIAPFILQVEHLAVGGVGLTKTRAEKTGLKVKAMRIQAWDKPHFMPDAEKAYVKIVYDPSNGRILGGQVACKHCNASRYIDLLSALIRKNATIEDLVYTETSYMPRVSEVYSPLFVVGESILRRLKKI